MKQKRITQIIKERRGKNEWQNNYRHERHEGRLECRICGFEFDRLGLHVRKYHRTKMERYNEVFGLKTITILQKPEKDRAVLTKETGKKKELTANTSVKQPKSALRLWLGNILLKMIEDAKQK